MTSRSFGYTIGEDVLLCQVYLDISQDPITGRYQSGNEFWSRVEENYNELRHQHLEYRTKRSLHSRMDIIAAEVKKLNGCLKQIENMNPSGASDEDIVSIYLTYFSFYYYYIEMLNSMLIIICSYIEQMYYSCKNQSTEKASNLIMFGIWLKILRNLKIMSPLQDKLLEAKI